ncbi:MAG: sugar phosphate isomerase/epimerase family protein [Pseudomonadota bacterium]
MKISISNIAWDPDEDEEVAELLTSRLISSIDVAPGKYFPDPVSAKERDVLAVRAAWEKRGFAIEGMQALLFGTVGMNMFGPEDVRCRMLDHLLAVCRIGGWLGARRLVFGSPRNRDRSGLGDEAAMGMARDFFRRLGDIAANHGVVVCLEPNPPRYGANFMVDAASTAAVVREVAHPAIRMQFDLGAVVDNREDLLAIVREYGGLTGHIHLSEPGLVPLGDAGTQHDLIAPVLRGGFPDRLACIEMVATTAEPHVQAIARALDVACRYYAGPDQAQ